MHSNPTQMVRPNVDMRTVSMHPFHKKGSNGTVSKFQAFAEINMKQGVTSMKSNESRKLLQRNFEVFLKFSKFSIQQVGERFNKECQPQVPMSQSKHGSKLMLIFVLSSIPLDQIRAPPTMSK